MDECIHRLFCLFDNTTSLGLSGSWGDHWLESHVMSSCVLIGCWGVQAEPLQPPDSSLAKAGCWNRSGESCRPVKPVRFQLEVATLQICKLPMALTHLHTIGLLKWALITSLFIHLLCFPKSNLKLWFDCWLQSGSTGRRSRGDAAWCPHKAFYLRRGTSTCVCGCLSQSICSDVQN